MKNDSEASGVLLLRTWLHEGRLVARVIASRDGAEGQESQLAVGNDAIAEMVAAWLRDFTETPR